MKKVLIITAITVFGFAKGFSQDIKFGVKAGVNFANLYGDNTEAIDPITSILNFGLVAEIPLSEKLSFQPEIMYSTQGYGVDDNIVSLNYLNLPLMGKYYVTKGFSVEAGPQLGFLLSAKDEDTDTDLKDNFKTVDFGVNLGLGYKLDNGLNFGARYNLGLSNINAIDGSSDAYKNGVFQVTIGYFFF